jgi:hypothetical protein
VIEPFLEISELVHNSEGADDDDDDAEEEIHLF